MPLLRDPAAGIIRFAGIALRLPDIGVTPPPSDTPPPAALVDSNGNGLVDSNGNYLTAS